eukprot:gnl/Ergobibamus_cyprinoides/360.p1 GENE.gnl/Ergobibamus_cyprinoides/360~~gnl/Ergobibamus_cyprinoides/360.p1  ORF type:complete len:300 (+),score=46.19 gnl/Ergobibamus_cyprinoides/360:112-900(+)
MLLTDERPMRQVNELMNFFLGPRARTLYDVSLCLYMYGSLLSYTTVFLSTMVKLLPMFGASRGDCIVGDAANWNSACEGSFFVYLAIFAAIVISLVLRDLKEQVPVQVALTCLRFVAISTIVVTTVVAMFRDPYDAANARTSAPYLANDWTWVTWSGFGHVFLTSLFAQLCHHSNPGLISLLAPPTGPQPSAPLRTRFRRRPSFTLLSAWSFPSTLVPGTCRRRLFFGLTMTGSLTLAASSLSASSSRLISLFSSLPAICSL